MVHHIAEVVSTVNREIWRHQPGQARSSVGVLRAQWPQTYRALVETWFDSSLIGRTYDGNRNDAGYLVRGLEAVYEAACDRYEHLRPARAVIDQAMAREVRFQWSRQRQARDLRAYLVRCWLNLLVERPERIWPERYATRNRVQQ